MLAWLNTSVFSKQARQPNLAGMIAYAVPACALNFILSPAWSIIPGIYAKYYGLELTVIAAVLFYSRLIDALANPVVGFISDYHIERGGRRSSWVVSGGVLLILCSYFLFTPPDHINAAYFLFWSASFFVAVAIFEISHIVSGAEIAKDYNDRAKIYSFRQTMLSIGEVLFFLLPLLAIFSVDEYTPETLKVAVYFGAALMIVSLVLFWLYSPHKPSLAENPAKTGHKPFSDITLAQFIQSFTHNKPLLIFFLASFFAYLSIAMWTGLQFIYLDAYLALGDKIPYILIAGTFAGLLSVPLWFMLVSVTSKSVTFGLGMAFFSLLLLGNYFIEPGMPWYLSALFVGGAYMGFACLNVTIPALLGDISDYGMFKFGKYRGGTYFSCSNLLFKINIGFGGAIALSMAGSYGLDPASLDQSDQAVYGIKLAFIILPVCFGLLSAALILLSPLSKKRHTIILKALERRSVQ